MGIIERISRLWNRDGFPQISGYRIERKLGGGYSRTAYLARRLAGDSEYPRVVKVFRTDGINPGVEDEREFVGLSSIVSTTMGRLLMGDVILRRNL